MALACSTPCVRMGAIATVRSWSCRLKVRKRKRLARVRRALRAGSSSHSIPPSSLRQRSEEHTSELQSLMRISYAVFCLKKKKKQELKQQRHRINIARQQETPKSN